MGRLIPAGTGMKYYRNVKVDHDPTMNQKVVDEFDDEFPVLTGGLDLPSPMDMPGVSDDFEDDLEDIEDYEDEETELDLETEEVFEAEAGIDDLGDDDDF